WEEDLEGAISIPGVARNGALRAAAGSHEGLGSGERSSVTDPTDRQARVVEVVRVEHVVRRVPLVSAPVGVEHLTLALDRERLVIGFDDAIREGGHGDR